MTAAKDATSRQAQLRLTGPPDTLAKISSMAQALKNRGVPITVGGIIWADAFAHLETDAQPAAEHDCGYNCRQPHPVARPVATVGGRFTNAPAAIDPTPEEIVYLTPDGGYAVRCGDVNVPHFNEEILADEVDAVIAALLPMAAFCGGGIVNDALDKLRDVSVRLYSNATSATSANPTPTAPCDRPECRGCYDDLARCATTIACALTMLGDEQYLAAIGLLTSRLEKLDAVPAACPHIQPHPTPVYPRGSITPAEAESLSAQVWLAIWDLPEYSGVAAGLKSVALRLNQCAAYYTQPANPEG